MELDNMSPANANVFSRKLQKEKKSIEKQKSTTPKFRFAIWQLKKYHNLISMCNESHFRTEIN
jgi:hypothetical protein